MYIQQLCLTHYRGAASLSLNLHERLNVLVGVNGAGKSTVLDAIAILLSWMVSRIRQSGTSGRSLSEAEIMNGESWASLEIVCGDEHQSLSWRLSKSRRGHGSPLQPSDLQQLSHYTKTLQGQISQANSWVNLPLFVYYPVHRAVLDIPLRIRSSHRFDLLSAYDQSLTTGANFRTFFEWFREREDLENEILVQQLPLFREEGQQVHRDRQLEAVRAAISQLLPEFQHLTVRRSPLRMEVEKNGEVLTVNQLSDGEKCLIAMVGDLARRMAIANATKANPLDGEGVILIDELELHLHPKWQRMIAPRLRQVFPNCQFIVSTHSPHILTHVEAETIVLLTRNNDEIQVKTPSESYGKSVERILEDIMELETTRPTVVSQKLHEIYEMISVDQCEIAHQQIQDMRQLIGDDPELTKAEILIQRKKLIGK
ncbi:AAA family ATPase [Phormidium yuhuli AB48]|uniref:AAA family ATPase n=1 Tax=Phormidium yuhuli AB48 TaxID=2940671 RepID=A0ABY5AQW3_9CYAN|nr:AAA family ATPase [Phormidium yuhuli]USR91609.1 AAA family ATPase [Phormidium yuhuli AB48]